MPKDNQRNKQISVEPKIKGGETEKLQFPYTSTYRNKIQLFASKLLAMNLCLCSMDTTTSQQEKKDREEGTNKGTTTIL